MFTKNLEFSNDEIKRQYRIIINDHPALSGVLLHQYDLVNNQLMIQDIVHNLYGINIVVISNKEEGIVEIDFLTKEIKINNKLLPYKIIYDNNKRKNAVPGGYEYQSENRIVFLRNTADLDKKVANHYSLIVNEEKMNYNISINNFNNNFDINFFIKALTNYDGYITSIRELLTVIAKLIDLRYFELKISDTMGNLIGVKYGELSDYTEYRDTINESKRIFLRNNEFLVERRIKEKYDDNDIVPFMKKIGVYNGKEKR